ncbi:MAG: thiamine-phosphate synthase family protein [Thermoproteota archaeon]
MLAPQDFVAKTVSPKLKALVAHKLRDMGLSQDRIAKLMGITQPMVSRYLRARREELLGYMASTGIDAAEVESVASVLAAKLARGDLEGYITTYSEYLDSLLARGVLCKLHRELLPGALEDCDVCMRRSRGLGDPLVAEVEEAVKLLISHAGSYKIVPNVGSNVVAARSGARSLADVVGLTGGIVRVGTRSVPVGVPAYGGSRHTAAVLLAVHSKWPSKRAAVVLAYTAECVRKLAEQGLKVVKTGPHDSLEKLVDDLKRALEEVDEEVDAVADMGGHGIEPVIYVFASNAREAVERALACAEA